MIFYSVEVWYNFKLDLKSYDVSVTLDHFLSYLILYAYNFYVLKEKNVKIIKQNYIFNYIFNMDKLSKFN